MGNKLNPRNNKSEITALFLSILRLQFSYLLIIFMMGCGGVKPPYGSHKADQRKKEKRFGTNRSTNHIFHDLAIQEEIDHNFDGVLLSFETIPKKRIATDGLTYVQTLDKYKLNFNSAFNSKQWDRQNRQTKDVLNGNRSMVLTHSFTMFNQKKDFLYNIYSRDLKDWDKPYDLYDSSKIEFGKLGSLLSKKLKDKKYTHLILMSTGWNNQQQKSIYHYNRWLNNIKSAAKESGENFKPLYVALTWPSFVKRPHLLNILNKVEYTGVDLFIEQNNADELGITHINYLLWNVLIPLSDENKVPLVLLGHSFGARILTRASHSAVYMGKPASEIKEKIDLMMSFQGAYRLSRHIGGGRGADNSIYTLSDPWRKFVATTSKFDKPFKTGKILTGLFIGHSKVLGKVNTLKGYEVKLVNNPKSLGIDKTVKHTILECSPFIGHHQDVTNIENGRLIWHYIRTLRR